MAPSPPAGPCRLGWGPGSRISRPPRPEVTIRHVPNPSTPFSRLHEHDRPTRAASPPRPVPVNPCGRCKHPHSALKPCTGLFDYLCASDLRSPRLFCASDLLVISALLSSSLVNTPAPPSFFLALYTDSFQDRSSCWIWSSRAGPRAGPPTLRSANARRRRRAPGPAPGSRPVHFASRSRRARNALLHADLRARGRLGRRDAGDARS